MMIFRRFLSIIGVFLALLISNSVLGQTPQGINYQAVARIGDNVMNDATIAVEFTLKNNMGGTSIYTEVHTNVKTNKYGMFNLVIGTINPTDFANVNWALGNIYIQSED